MPVDLHFELRLEERLPDRVFVSVVLAPLGAQPAPLDGVSLQMVDRAGEALGARMVLPLSGCLHQPLVTTVEVRARGAVPTGARVGGVVWVGSEQREASCPCDPGTQLEVHLRGRRTIGLPVDDDGLRSLDSGERAVLARYMPWVNEPMVPRAPPQVLEPPEPEPEEVVDEVAEQFGLDEEDAAFLRELLEEDSI